MSEREPGSMPDLGPTLEGARRAGALDEGVYREVRDDVRQTVPALLIAALVMLLGAIGGWVWLGLEFDGIDTGRVLVREVLLGTLFAFGLWALWVVIARALLRRETEVAELSAAFRCMGYAAVPGALAFFVWIPALSLGIGIAALAAWFASSDLALRAIAPAASGRALTIANGAGFLAFAVVLAILGRQAGAAPGPFVHAGGVSEYFEGAGTGDLDLPSINIGSGDESGNGSDGSGSGSGVFGDDDGSGSAGLSDGTSIDVIDADGSGATFEVADLRAGDVVEPVRQEVFGSEREGIRLGDLLAHAGIEDWEQVVVSGALGTSLTVDRSDLDADPAAYLLWWDGEADADDTLTLEHPLTGGAVVDVARIAVRNPGEAGGDADRPLGSGDVDALIERYSNLMGDLGDTLEGIDSVGDAQNARDRLRQLFDEFEAVNIELAAANPDALGVALAEADGLEARIEKVSRELSRIVEDSDLASELGPYLGGPPIVMP